MTPELPLDLPEPQHWTPQPPQRFIDFISDLAAQTGVPIDVNEAWRQTRPHE